MGFFKSSLCRGTHRLTWERPLGEIRRLPRLVTFELNWKGWDSSKERENSQDLPGRENLLLSLTWRWERWGLLREFQRCFMERVFGLCWSKSRHEVTKSGQIINETHTPCILFKGNKKPWEIRILREEIWRGFHFRKALEASLWREDEEVWRETEEKKDEFKKYLGARVNRTWLVGRWEFEGEEIVWLSVFWEGSLRPFTRAAHVKGWICLGIRWCLHLRSMYYILIWSWDNDCGM